MQKLNPKKFAWAQGLEDLKAPGEINESSVNKDTPC